MNRFQRYLGSSFECTINNINRKSTQLPSHANTNKNNNTKRSLPSAKEIEASQTQIQSQSENNDNNSNHQRRTQWSMNSVALASSKESWMSMSRTASK
mmetsp:Transcript_63608/g.57279  ORF Transcript_63608/g.57279 Transcript_63608/m.57279 type:complete len:98 (+) Transcript_63608:59-352(+)